MKINFTKMHGAGNDYIYINAFDHEIIENPTKVAKIVSDRHFGIGGDGLVLIEPSYVADARMRMFNADGSESEMCGNAIRCVAKYLYDNNIKRKENLVIETGRGNLNLEVFEENGVASKIRVSMGTPILKAEDIPVKSSKTPVLNEEIEIDGEIYKFNAVSMGNPHAVIYVDSVDNFPVEKVGSKIENNTLFPKRVNVEFVEIISENEVKQRTWERGSGETLACGTGASAVCVSGISTGKTTSPLKVNLLGGVLTIEWDGKSEVFMSGGAEFVFNGEMDLTDLL